MEADLEYITISQAAIVINRSEKTVRHYCKSGEIETKKEKGKLLVSVSSLWAFCNPLLAGDKKQEYDSLVDEYGEFVVTLAQRKVISIMELDKRVRLYRQEGHSPKKAKLWACRSLGISIRSYFRWKREYRLHGMRGLLTKWDHPRPKGFVRTIKNPHSPLTA